MSKHPLSDTYRSMLGRCYYKPGPSYKNYGGKGVYVCDRWRVKRVGFRAFIADMGPKPTPQHTLDRIDRDGPYSPENCRWATRRDQMLNTSRTVTVEFDGVLYKTAELAEKYGISQSLVASRAKAGLTFEQVISRHHLEPGYVHMAAIIAKSAAMNWARTHCGRGHELAGDNLAFRSNGQRVCRKCVAMAQHRYRERLRSKG